MTTGKATFRASNSPQGLTENMQILTGQKGDRLDKALTLREAAAIGMVNLRRNGSGQIVPELPPATSGDPEWSGVQQPVAPTGVTVDGAFHAVTLTWDAPAYNGHAFAEVWRAQENNLAKAVRVGTTLANVYSDAVGKGFKAFYWVRFVNKNAFAGPYQSTGGIPAETSRDVQDVLDAIKGKIENSHLAKELLDPIQQVPQLGARITEETQARVSADQALSTQISTVSAKANGLDAALQVQGRAVSDLQNGAQAIWAVKAQAGDIKAGIGLVARGDGTSQVMISASQLFVFNPNSPNAAVPLFAIDNGQTVITEAMIRKATIQILNSERITADYIKAGVSISSPLITGGQFDMGNAFMAGGAAGFGLGGRHGGWGKGWHTIIYSDGAIYTDRLHAYGVFCDTLNLQGNAVTVPVTVTQNNGNRHIPANTPPGPIVASAYGYHLSQPGFVTVIVNAVARGGGGTNLDIALRVITANSWGTVHVWQHKATSLHDAWTSSNMFVFSFYLGAGTFDFHIQAGNGWRDGTAILAETSMVILGSKR